MSRSIVRITFIFLFIYAVLAGGNFQGILVGETRLISLGLLLALAGAWLGLRRRAGWRWHGTPLDAVLPLWGLAFGLALLFNLDASRRILLSLWYIGVYIGLWYLLHDVLANRGLARQTLVDAVLFSGLLVVALGYVELRLAITATGESAFIYRPRSIIGNPNTLGPYLVVLLTFVLDQAYHVRLWLVRGALAVYAVLAGALLFLTFSRGSWLGLGGAIVVWIALRLAARRLLSPQALRAWWWQQKAALRRGMLGAGLALAGAVGVMAVRVGRSFLDDTMDLARGFSFRPQLFDVAWNMFSDSPLVGRGPFTFGRYMGRLVSLPPMPPHVHAHSLPVNLAAELGLVGLVVSGVTVYWLIRSLRQNGQFLSRYTLLGAAATAGFGLTHLFDLPSIVPVVALTGLVALVLLTAPAQPVPLAGRQAAGSRWIGAAGLWLVLLAGGLWDAGTYARYLQILFPGVAAGQYVETADALAPVIEADPALVVYQAQQAYLWGLAANTGDRAAQAKAITAYERVIELEPYYAPYYANLGILYWNAGQMAQGLEMMQRAAALAPEAWQLQYNAGLYAEALGAEEPARAAYAQALRADPDADLHPSWGQTALQAEFRTSFDRHSALAKVALLTESGQFGAAAAMWESEFAAIGNPHHYVLLSILALAQGERDQAGYYYERARNAAQNEESDLWLLLGEARLARYDGDEAAADRALASAREQRAYRPLSADYLLGADIASFHFFRQAIPRQFLPQVFYPANRVILLYLLDKS